MNVEENEPHIRSVRLDNVFRPHMHKNRHDYSQESDQLLLIFSEMDNTVKLVRNQTRLIARAGRTNLSPLFYSGRCVVEITVLWPTILSIVHRKMHGYEPRTVERHRHRWDVPAHPELQITRRRQRRIYQLLHHNAGRVSTAR